jgi:hypothetical protein
LAAKSLETIKLTESLSVDPESPDARAALAEHLAELREMAATLGFVHLEASLRAALEQLTAESFSPVSLLAVRVLALKYQELAGMPSRSGTHAVVAEASGETTVRSLVLHEPLTRLEECLTRGAEACGDLEEFGVSDLFRAVRRLRPDTRVVLQDPWSLFEVELSGGRIVDVTRTAIDGTVTHGPSTLMLLAGMSSGRFVVAEPTTSVKSDGESGEGSRAVVDALLVTLARQGVVRDVVVPEALEVTEAETDLESEQLEDPLERENFRAQWAVSMHREPANRVSRFSDTIWRRKAESHDGDDEFLSGFGLEVRSGPKVLGWGFAAVFCATVGFLLWREGVRISEQVYSDAEPTSGEAQPVTGAATRGNEEAVLVPTRTGLSAYAGAIRPGVARSLAVSEAQGVLELTGSEAVALHVDGVDRGSLPVTLVLDEGRHVVRYRVDEGWTYRFYYVKAGATRVIRVSPAQSGFVDAL